MPVIIIIAAVGVVILAIGSALNDQQDVAESSPDEVTNYASKPRNVIPVVAIMNYAYNAGFDDSNVITAVAIALAESRGGDTNAYNPELAAGTPTGLGSVGLWQIYQKAHPEFADVDLTNPEENAKAAFLVYQRAGNSFRPWTTYTGLWRDRLGNDANGNPKWGPVVKHAQPYMAYLQLAQNSYDQFVADASVQTADSSTLTDTEDSGT